MTKRPILTTFKREGTHWVGDGFRTQTLLPPDFAKFMSPFILAGYNPPMWFDATDKPKGIGLHPHRGFETITIVFQGGVEHGDTMGNHGTIGPGDVQWMTAASGVQHEEYHSDLINENGGMLEMVQMWVNLPASQKMSKPRYQDIRATDIPEVKLGNSGKVRVIAGEYEGIKGPTETATPLQVWDTYLPKGEKHVIDRPEGETLAILLLNGSVQLNDDGRMTAPETVIFTTDTGSVELTATSDAHYLVLAGEPINEPIAMGGPFVMNTEQELRQAYVDFSNGQF